jgi:molecular chaperone DnaJ
MAERDYYDVLGIPRTASQAEVKKAFRQLARRFHPDVNQESDASDRFKEINAAYEVLNDPDKRARYDRFGHAGVNADPNLGGFGTNGFDDLFEQFFGGFASTGGRRAGAQRRGPARGRDLSYELAITFEEAVTGVEKEIEINRYERCEECNGSGAAPGTTPSRCPECNGTGEVRSVRQTFLGSMISVNACPRCQGRGEVITTPCDVCGGGGRMRATRRLKVTIPAGVDQGMKIRIAGEGEPGEFGGPPGNLYVVVNVKAHKYFKRRNDDILLEITINMAQAALGDHVKVPTVEEGDTDLVIPAGTQTGESFRLRNKGFPRLRRDGTAAGRGDEWIIVQVAVPKNLTDRQRELLEELAETLDTNIIPPQNKSFFDRVINFLSGEG